MWIWSKKLAKEKAMVKIKRFPNSIEQSEAASKAVEYLIEIGVMDTNKTHELHFLILNVIEDYLKAQEKEQNGIELGGIGGNQPLQKPEQAFPPKPLPLMEVLDRENLLNGDVNLDFLEADDEPKN
jgi:hypothetical protein